MTRTRRNLAEPQSLQRPPDGRFIQRDAEFLEDPVRQVLEPPAHHPVSRRDRSAFDDLGQRLALAFVELPRLARCLAIDQSAWTFGVEAQDPIPDDLTIDPANHSRLAASAAIVDHGQCQQAARLVGVIRLPRKLAKGGSIIVIPERYGCGHGKPPIVCHGESHHEPLGNPPRESQSPQLGITGISTRVGPHLAGRGPGLRKREML
jgi:hypothetical protein